MRKILWAVIFVLAVGLIVFALTKIPKNFGFNKPSSHIQTTNIEPSVQIEGTNLYLAENGQVAGKASSPKPLLYLDKSLKISSGKIVTDPQILFAAIIASGLTKSDFSPTSIRLLPAGDIAVYSPQGAIAVFSQNKDAKGQIDSLQQVLAKAKIDATKIAKIDLRFDKPIITFK